MKSSSTRLAALAFVLMLTIPGARSAGSPSPVALRAPERTESFDLVVLGELVETGHPARPQLPDRPVPAIEPRVAAAVQAAAWLDPDMVMTTGNLISAPGSTARWTEQADALRTLMGGLGAPWYPVPGNSEFAGDGPDAPRAALYTRTLGPRRYAFDHRFALVIAIDTHDGGPARVSDDQAAWIGETLAHSDAKQVLVFAHADLWNTDPSAWERAHAVLAGDGRPVTVFASANRTYRDDGTRGSVSYYTLGPVDGRAPGANTDSYSWPHITLVRVRPGSVSPVVIPTAPEADRVGVLPAAWQTGAEVDRLRGLGAGGWVAVTGSVRGDIGGPLAGSIHVELTNPTDRPLPYTVACASGIGAAFSPERVDGTLEPGAVFAWDVAVSGGSLSTQRPLDHVRVSVRSQMDNGEVARFVEHVSVPIRPRIDASLAAASTDPGMGGALRLDGRSAIETDIALPGAFTLEAWVLAKRPRERAAVVSALDADAGTDGAGIFWEYTGVGDPVPAGLIVAGGQPVVVRARDAWAWDDWGHLALTCDGERARLFINGELVDEQPVGAPISAPALPLIIGASPRAASRPEAWFAGQIDEVRLSEGARYGAPFTPTRTLARDGTTLMLFHFDQEGAPAGADDSGREHHGWTIGKPARVPLASP